MLHNNAAWLSARCERQLDVAMRHAKEAVKLSPKNASYLDTLAETHFRMGNREAALRFSRQAVRLSPHNKTITGQLYRFENDPLPNEKN